MAHGQHQIVMTLGLLCCAGGSLGISRPADSGPATVSAVLHGAIRAVDRMTTRLLNQRQIIYDRHGNPLLVCEQPTYDFGTAWSGTIVRHDFTIKNVSLETVWIKARQVGSGSHREDPIEIGPGQAVAVPVQLHTLGMAGRLTKKCMVELLSPPG